MKYGKTLEQYRAFSDSALNKEFLDLQRKMNATRNHTYKDGYKRAMQRVRKVINEREAMPKRRYETFTKPTPFVVRKNAWKEIADMEEERADRIAKSHPEKARELRKEAKELRAKAVEVARKKKEGNNNDI